MPSSAKRDEKLKKSVSKSVNSLFINILFCFYNYLQFDKLTKIITFEKPTQTL